MSFSEPAVLWALPLAAAPLLLQLFWRRPRGRRPFSDLSLLRRVSERLLPRSRLRQWLLAALRSLLLLSLILAFAGPVLSGRAEASRRGAAPRRLDLVVLVDESYSMGYRQDGRSRFDLARSQLSGLLRALGPADRVALIPFSDRLESVRPAEWLSPSLALDVLPRLSSGWRATDYAPPLEAAAVLLRGDTRARRVVLLLGDGARHGLRGPLPTLPPGVLFFGLRWPQASNAWISSAAAEDAAPSPKLLVRLEGISAARSLELWKDGRLSGSSLLSAGAGSASLALPQAPPQGGGAWSGKLALRADDLPADDSYFVSLSYPARPRLLCLYGDPGFFRLPAAGYFLRKLFGQDRGSLLPFNADFLDVARLPQARLSDYQMALLCDVRGVTAEAAARLEGFVRAGGSLLVAPGPGGLEGLEALAAALPARWGPVVEGEGGGLAAGPGALPGQWSGYELGKVSLRRYQLLSPKPGARLLLRSADGYPLLVCAALGRGRAALWASTIDAAWTDLPLKPVFPAWLEAGLGLARVSAGAKRPRLQLKVGEPLRRVWNADEPVPQSVRLRDPRGREQTLWPRGRAVEYAGSETPGLYSLTESGSGRRTVYAVNLDRSSGESDLAPPAAAPWRLLEESDLAADFRRQVYGRDARAAALAAAALLLAAEMLLALPRVGAAALLLLLAFSGPVRAQEADRFVWTQLNLGPGTDPYPQAWSEATGEFGLVTSALTAPRRRFIALDDPRLDFSPLVILAARRAPPELGRQDALRLRDYLTAGGTLWIEDVSGSAESAFDRWVRRTLRRVLPESELSPLPPDHVVYRTFFLLRGAAGRVMVSGSLEGLSWDGRAAVIYSRDDLLGVWPKDALGQPLYPCLPGFPRQRRLARELTINILMYALTGSYKDDAVHQPYILRKLGESP